MTPRRDEEGHPAAGHPPSIRKPQKSSPSVAFASRMIDSVNRLLTQGMIPLIGPSQFRVVSPRPERPGRRPKRTAATIWLEDPEGLGPAFPFGIAPEEVFLGDHVQDRPDVLGHPAVDQDQALGQPSVELGPSPAIEAGPSRISWAGRSRPRLIPDSGSDGHGGDPRDHLDPGKTPPESCQPPPEPPSHSPRMARATTTGASSGRASRSGSGPGRSRASGPRSSRPAGSSRPPAATPWGCR